MKAPKRRIMSSFRQRVLEESSEITAKLHQPINPSNIERSSFETCFSAGLDLTDFFPDDNDGGDRCDNNADLINRRPRTAVSSSAALAQKEVSVALSRRNKEEREEAAFERRVADVVDAAKSKSPTKGNNDVGVVIPTAPHPNNTKDGMTGGDRDDNFLKFHCTSLGGINNGFLSSLVVSNHKSEMGKQGGVMSHKSRTTLHRNNSQSKKHRNKSLPFPSTSSTVGVTRRQQKGNVDSTKTGKAGAAKKSRVSKY
jgi:hypothetical protein